jgi:hypothetical protein
MNRWRPNYLNFSVGRAVIIATLMMIAVAADPASLLCGLKTKLAWSETAVLAQDDALEALREDYDKMDVKENFNRRASFIMLLPYLPPGARMTSGYRSPEKQLEVIGSYARRLGIQVPSSMTVDDEQSWRPTLMALRSRGIIIAAPTTTPHGDDEAVLDLAGADLGTITERLRKAEKEGIVKFRRIILEPRNGAVHIEIDSFSSRALNELGKRKSSSRGTTPETGEAVAPQSLSADAQRPSMLSQLQNLHDVEPQPAKRIDYDRSIRNLLDPVRDADRIKALADEMRQHLKEAQDIAKENLVKTAYDKISDALNDDRYEDAEREAESFAKKFPKLRQAQSMLKQVKTRRLISEAQDALYASDKPGCGECQKASELINEALNLYPNHEGALSIKEEVDVCLEPCTSKTLIVVVVLGLLTFVLTASGIGFFFLSWSGASPVTEGFKAPAWVAEKVRGSHGWVLEGIEGAGKGQTFTLDKEKIVVGSQGPPDGTADIVICDAQRKISRQHCLIMHNGKQFYLLDESTNGTKINGHELQRGVVAEFRGGDQISLADVAVLLLRPQ